MNELSSTTESTGRASPGLAVAMVWLGKSVRGLRETLGLTQSGLAKRCGVSESYVSLLERGERSPSFEMLVRLATVLEVPMAELFQSSDEPVVHFRYQRLADFGKQHALSRMQMARLIAVAEAMFGLQPTGSKVKSSDVCTVEGCQSFALAKGLCSKHYQRARLAPRNE